ncbi:MAG TPA: ATP-binding cassette domain-containing protein, partial [Thermodesulfobacteriota bacterium]
MLALESVDAAYGDAQALWNVSLTVGRGEIVTLLGANGAGKTTTLRTISGLLRPRRGRVLLDGKRLDTRPAHEVAAAGIGHVPEARRLFANMTVRENLLMGAFRAECWADRQAMLERVFET